MNQLGVTKCADHYKQQLIFMFVMIYFKMSVVSIYLPGLSCSSLPKFE